MEFRAQDIATATGGTTEHGDLPLTGATIDSRAVTSGQLFVPIIAERDGHDFIPSAIANGAAGTLTDRPLHLDQPAAVIRVEDTTKALQELAVAARARITAPLVGITGSVGKTSAKDLVVAACGPTSVTHANPGSFNNELGLPLTLINTPDDAEIVVTEMGARGPGHIAHLCDIAQPTIGVVTRVAGAHTELFGSLDAIAEAKGELIEALPANGTAVLNADDHRVLAMSERAKCPVITFGLAEDANVRIVDLTLDAQARPRFTLQLNALEIGDQTSRPIHLPVSGAHMALNAAAAVAVGLTAGINLEALADGLTTAVLSAHRMSLVKVASGATVINDAYNANPTSMRAALETLGALDVERRTAVVGVMAELGENGDADHANIAQEAAAAGTRVIAVAAPEYGPEAIHVETVEQAVQHLADTDARDGVLVKGSRVAALERVVHLLGPH